MEFKIDYNEIVEFAIAPYHPSWHGMGGYPADYDFSTIPGYLIIAYNDDAGEPTLEILDFYDLIVRYIKAQMLYQEWIDNGDADEYDDTDLSGAWSEIG